MKIGVFDSGAGGEHVAATIRQNLPSLEVVYKEDKKHVPYGTRSISQIHEFVKPIFQEFIDEGCQIIVVACNTVTTNLIQQLRDEFKVPIIGIEPMVKPAAEATKTGIIAVCATPRTLESKRYQWLKATFAKGIKVLEPDCRDWALMIESNSLDRKKIKNTVEDACVKGADQIVLGCTHYHWIEEIIRDMAAGRAEVIQPEGAVVKQLKRVLENERFRL